MDDVRCPKCAALVASGAAWCSLCYHDLRPPAPEPEPTAVALAPEPVAVPVPDLGPAAPGGAGAPPRRGKHARRDPSATDPTAGPAGGAAPTAGAARTDLTGLEAAADAAAEELLTALRHESRLPSGVTQAVAQLDSVGAKAAVMVGGLVLVAGALVGLMALVGSFL